MLSNLLISVGLAGFAHAIYAMTVLVNKEDAVAAESGLNMEATIMTFTEPQYLIIAIEAVVSFIFFMLGFILRKPFHRARLIDNASVCRYDNAMHTGKGFIHFNQRGALGDGRHSNKNE